MNQDVIRRVEDQIAKIEVTLERMREGTFGQCILCSNQISKEELILDPNCIYCSDHLNQ